jgi:hypothetical protein
MEAAVPDKDREQQLHPAYPVESGYEPLGTLQLAELV